MIEGHDIVCFAPSDWWSMNPSCTTHLMSQFARTNRVLYVNPFSSDLLGGAVAHGRKGLAVRIKRKLRSYTKYLRQPEKNLYVLNPFFLPFQGKVGLDALNNLCLRAQIKSISRGLGFHHPLVWMENARAADALGWFRPQATIYHVSDLFAADDYISNERAQRQREARLSSSSDLLICVSRGLYELKRAQRGNVYYLPHGVDFELFRQAAERRQLPAEMADIPKPVAGYYGTMTASNDIEMMTYCARNLPHVSFVFAGQITTGDYSELASLPNVHLLGRLPYETIPALCAGFDVCMLQWKACDWIRQCNPLKMLEYMASGNPIVSVEIDEAGQYGDLISMTRSKEEFCQAIQWELENDTPQRRDQRIEVASRHSWANHAEQISQWIEQTMVAKQSPAP